MLKAQIFVAGTSLLLFIITIALIRKRKLKEEYSIIWIIAEVVLFAFGIFPRGLTMISEALGVYYLTAIFIAAFLFLLIIAFYYSIILSRLSDMNRSLVQEVAILKEKNEKK